MNKFIKITVLVSFLVLFFSFVSFPVSQITNAQEVENPRYIECGHCTDEPVDGLACGEGSGCEIDVMSLLKIMPYYGIPDVYESTPQHYKILFFAMIAGLIVLIFI